jgi:hypothetical protein
MRAASFAAGFIAVALLGSAVVLSDDERTRICRPGAAAAGRPSSDAWLKLRQQVFERAGVSFPAHHADFEVYHRIPRCLDGPNTLDNLQLQPWPEARAKDLREAEVCRAYCAGKLTLETARSMFERDKP